VISRWIGLHGSSLALVPLGLIPSILVYFRFRASDAS
jgi:hypothetical protein